MTFHSSCSVLCDVGDSVTFYKNVVFKPNSDFRSLKDEEEGLNFEEHLGRISTSLEDSQDSPLSTSLWCVCVCMCVLMSPLAVPRSSHLRLFGFRMVPILIQECVMWAPPPAAPLKGGWWPFLLPY